MAIKKIEIKKILKKINYKKVLVYGVLLTSVGCAATYAKYVTDSQTESSSTLVQGFDFDVQLVRQTDQTVTAADKSAATDGYGYSFLQQTQAGAGVKYDLKIVNRSGGPIKLGTVTQGFESGFAQPASPSAITLSDDMSDADIENNTTSTVGTVTIAGGNFATNNGNVATTANEILNVTVQQSVGQ
ncbi:MAG: hypothetical protein LBT37_08215 [Lactobacillaceae bacterium]|jgi:hypothetical protein|nr:hypothetical protein [Lactobacillaceae bacterium]